MLKELHLKVFVIIQIHIIGDITGDITVEGGDEYTNAALKIVLHLHSV